MTTATDTPTRTPEPPKSVLQLFKWSSYIHVGEGADECANAKNGKCVDENHFHAWIRLPNKFQEEEIQEKALAARARRLRLLADRESDIHMLVEHEIMSASIADAINELLASKYSEDYDQARLEVLEDDRERYEHIYDDLERYNSLRDMGPEKREEASAEAEFKELDRHLNEYHELVTGKIEVIEAHRRTALEALPSDQIRRDLRERRLDIQGTTAFFKARQIWTILAGSFRPSESGTPTNRLFLGGEDDLRELPEPVLEAVARGFNELQSSMEKGGGRGN